MEQILKNDTTLPLLCCNKFINFMEVNMEWKSIKKFKTESYQANSQNFDLFDEWARDKGTLVWSPNVHISSLNRLIKNGEKLKEMPPKTDHVQIFKSKEAGKVYYVYHPYTDFEELNNSIEIWNKDEKYNIKVYDSKHSWYGFGANMVILTLN